MLSSNIYDNQGGIWRGGRGDMSPSLDFGVPLTGIDSVIPGWDAFNPLTGTNFVRQSVIWIHSNDGHKHNGAKS